MKIEIDTTIKTVINAIPNPVILTNGDKLQSANNAFLELTGVDSAEAFNERYGSVDNLFLKEEGFFSKEEIEDGACWTDYLFIRPNIRRIVSMSSGDSKVLNFEITLKKLENQPEYLVVFNDITSHILEKNEYEYFAYHDHLTKIYNRLKFEELLLKAMENQKRYGDRLCIILIDIDHFKNVNDTFGHLVGDLTLVMLTTLIARQLRLNDLFARWGGEEFIILLPRTDVERAYEKALQLRNLVESHIDEHLPAITISLGVTEVTAADTINSAFKRVDEALFMAKEQRNHVVKID